MAFGIQFSEALDVGINILAGFDPQLMDLKKEVKQLEGELQFKQLKLKELLTDQKKKKNSTEFDNADDLFAMMNKRGGSL